MGIYYCSKSRRQFLIGTGQALLSLPLLPSLLPRTAEAQQMAMPPRRMMLFLFEHNNLDEIWPAKARATQAVGSLGMREIPLSQLGTVASHSYGLSHPIYETLKNANQLTYLRGFRQDGWNGCHGDMYLSAVGSSRNAGDYQRPTADQVFEMSSTLYPVGTPLSVRKALRVSLGGENKHVHKVGSTMTKPPVYEGYQIQNFYNDVFGSLTEGTVPVTDLNNQLKTNILNRVVESYRSFQGNRRISSEDRERVNQHMDLLSDLQRTYQSLTPAVQVSCNRPANPGSIGGSPVMFNRAYLNLLAVAFQCGITKFSTMLFDSHDPQWIPNLGINDFHGAIHGQQGAGNQLRAFQNWWRYLGDQIATNFLTPLNQQDGNSGRTYLENMITGFVCTGGFHPNQANNDGGHGGYDSQQILIGSMGGRLRSGSLYNLEVQNTQYPYNGFLLTMFHLMGIPESEYRFATPDGRGFGLYTGYGSNYRFANRFYSPITEVLSAAG